MLSLSDDKKRFIETNILAAYELLSEEELMSNVGDEKVTQLQLANLQKLELPEELHFLMDNWNWDDGTHIPYQILAHPACDKGTALMIYWLMDPDFYTKYHSISDVPGYEQEDFIVLKNLEKRLLHGDFKTSNIKFTPSSHVDWMTLESSQVPAALKLASEGEEWEEAD